MHSSRGSGRNRLAQQRGTRWSLCEDADAHSRVPQQPAADHEQRDQAGGKQPFRSMVRNLSHLAHSRARG